MGTGAHGVSLPLAQSGVGRGTILQVPPLPDFLTDIVASPVDPRGAAVRLVLSLIFGLVVALVYRFSRPADEITHSFSATLVLLTILIAMVTQVIGDSVARAFSLVGALSIVRFRTVVRDTQDTAYVIFAVVIGMAVGASDPWVGVIGIAVVSLAAFLLRAMAGNAAARPMPYRVDVRVDAAHDPRRLLAPILDEHAPQRALVSMSTARQGAAYDVSYRAALPAEGGVDALVKALRDNPGVVSVQLTRTDVEDAKG